MLKRFLPDRFHPYELKFRIDHDSLVIIQQDFWGNTCALTECPEARKGCR